MTDTFTIPGVYRANVLRAGDTFTVAGYYALERNPDRRWWQLWKPRFVAGRELQNFVIVDPEAADG